MSINKKRDVWHIIPLDDLREHEESKDCWCKPYEDEQTLDIWIHNALDERESYEGDLRKPS